MNFYILIPVIIIAIAIVVWTIIKNNSDKENYEDFLNRDFNKRDDSDDVNDKQA